MLTDPKLRSQVDQLWEKLWSGGLTNPLDAIEQLSYLLFLKRLDDQENARARQAQRRGVSYEGRVPDDMRWSHWRHFNADEALEHVRTKVFPWLRAMGDKDSSFTRYMQGAEFKISKPSLLIEACNMIDQMQISGQNQDVQGDLYEYLLSRLNTAGRNGQFRTPRHIIRMMVKMIDPKPGERIGDLAAGTGGFLVNAYQYILEQHTSPEQFLSDDTGDDWHHGLVGDLLTDEQRAFLQKEAFRGYDNDSGMTMLRIGSMNMILHGIDSPRFFNMDTLSKAFKEERDYEVILMNPPFKGAVDKADVNPTLPSDTAKSELLFLHLILRVLDMGGRTAVIVPDGVLFGSSKAHIAIRRKIIEQHRLDGVVSMPGGVFKPYAGVSTAVLFFTRGAKTDRIWYYDMEHDGFSLDDKRQPSAENDISDVLECWRNRHNTKFQQARAARLAELREQIAPLKAEYLKHQGDINQFQFDSAIAPDGDIAAAAALGRARQELNTLHARLNPLQTEINQLTRQFWVTKDQVAANKYDLSASRYRQVERDEAYHEAPAVTIERIRELNDVMNDDLVELKLLLK